MSFHLQPMIDCNEFAEAFRPGVALPACEWAVPPNPGPKDSTGVQRVITRISCSTASG